MYTTIEDYLNMFYVAVIHNSKNIVRCERVIPSLASMCMRTYAKSLNVYLTKHIFDDIFISTVTHIRTYHQDDQPYNSKCCHNDTYLFVLLLTHGFTFIPYSDATRYITNGYVFENYTDYHITINNINKFRKHIESIREIYHVCNDYHIIKYHLQGLTNRQRCRHINMRLQLTNSLGKNVFRFRKTNGLNDWNIFILQHVLRNTVNDVANKFSGLIKILSDITNGYLLEYHLDFIYYFCYSQKKLVDIYTDYKNALSLVQSYQFE